MVGGVDWDDHNANLTALLQRLETHNLTLRKKKWEFGKSMIDFHGHLFTAEGLKPSPSKVKAVRECSPPKSKEEFVFFTNDGIFIEIYQQILEPLRTSEKINKERAQV